MKSTLSLALLLAISYVTCAQTTGGDKFHFRYLEDKLDQSSVDDQRAGNHFLGQDIARKMYMLQENYTWIQEGTPTNPASMRMVDKPAIYNNIKKLERFYKKGIKKGEISEDRAQEEFGQILDICLLIRNQKTATLEDTLDALKNEEDIVSLFTRQIELNYY